jgi:hypothetical protein
MGTRVISGVWRLYIVFVHTLRIREMPTFTDTLQAQISVTKFVLAVLYVTHVLFDYGLFISRNSLRRFIR